jgi:lysine biosynthesis protein LysW
MYQREEKTPITASEGLKMTAGTKMATASCPDCGRTIHLGTRPREGLRFICSSCRSHLELVSLEPLELDWAYSGFDGDPWSDVQKRWPYVEAGC